MTRFPLSCGFRTRSVAEVAKPEERGLGGEVPERVELASLADGSEPERSEGGEAAGEGVRGRGQLNTARSAARHKT